jgi:hypothetical protein
MARFLDVVVTLTVEVLSEGRFLMWPFTYIEFLLVDESLFNYLVHYIGCGKIDN